MDYIHRQKGNRQIRRVTSNRIHPKTVGMPTVGADAHKAQGEDQSASCTQKKRAAVLKLHMPHLHANGSDDVFGYDFRQFLGVFDATRFFRRLRF